MTVQQPCTLTSASITNCAGGSCDKGETVTMAASFTGPCTTGANTFFQIDAKSTDNVCNIEFIGGDMSGITKQNPTISVTAYSDTWSVPNIPSDCIGKTVHAWAASIWDGAPGTGTKVTSVIDAKPDDTSPVAGTLVFSTPPTCTYSLALQSISHFDVPTKIGTYALSSGESSYTWEIKAKDSSSADCPSSITYSIPSSSLVTIGKCDATTGVYDKNSNPPTTKINSFTILKGTTNDVFEVFVKPTTGPCTFSFGMDAPDGKQVDPIFTVTPTPPPPSGGPGPSPCDNICSLGEAQNPSCPNDCKTIITLTPDQILAGKPTTVKIDVSDGRYNKNDPIKLDLFIDGRIWKNSLCPISHMALDPTDTSLPSKGIKVTSNNIQAIVEATCTVPIKIKPGTHTLRVIPDIK